MQPFTIAVDDAVLDDLRSRIRATRWPDPSPAGPWEQGTDLPYLQGMLAAWADDFDWRERERALGRLHHVQVEVDGVRVHAVHERAARGAGIPLILGHGWPSAFTELVPLVPLLTDPRAYGIDGPAFDLVIPSLPGYGFSQRPRRSGIDYRYVAGQWLGLMRALGYERFGVGGGDFGAGVASFLALDHPESVIGVHLSNLELSPYLGPGSKPLSSKEKAYLEQSERWWRVEGGYKAIQSTRPQTLGYGLADSPAGLAGWILDKWRAWSDCDGDLASHIDRDFLLELLTIYWVTGSITSSMRDYVDNASPAVALGPEDRVRVPTGIASFVRQYVFEGDPPREWAERIYRVERWTPMPRGGHFAPIEEPEALAREIAAFFAGIG